MVAKKKRAVRKTGQRVSRKPDAKSAKRTGRKVLKKVGARRLPARSSSARDEKRGQNLVRLNKYMADHGVASRRACDQLIAKGKVSVDGQAVYELGSKIDLATAVVEIDGVILKPDFAERRYYLLNKPPGVVCTNEIRETRPKAVDLISDPKRGRIYTVGRLDEESRGLILLTNDGEFAQRIAHPSHGVSKTYSVRVQGRIEEDAVQKVRQGVHLSEGKTGGARILIKRRTNVYSTLEVTLQEGMNREIRRAFARVGYKVVDLERIQIGPLSVRGMKTGKWRALSREEVEALLYSPNEPLGADADEESESAARGAGRKKVARKVTKRARQKPFQKVSKKAGKKAGKKVGKKVGKKKGKKGRRKKAVKRGAAKGVRTGWEEASSHRRISAPGKKRGHKRS